MKKLFSPAALIIYIAAITIFSIVKIKRRREHYA